MVVLRGGGAVSYEQGLGFGVWASGFRVDELGVRHLQRPRILEQGDEDAGSGETRHRSARHSCESVVWQWHGFGKPTISLK